MATTYALEVKTARMLATRDQVAGGTIEIQAANNAVLAIFQLTGTAGTVTGATWTMAVSAATVQGLAAAGAGTVATKAQIKNAGGEVLISGFVVGAEVTLSNANIAQGQDVTFTAGTIVHAV